MNNIMNYQILLIKKLTTVINLINNLFHLKSLYYMVKKN